jgi:hypothetical protein
MIKTQLTSDKIAISLSLVCVLHCFFVPSFIILTPSFISFSLGNEFIHKVIVLVAVPVSFYALMLGYKNHKTTSYLPAGILGLLTIIFAVVLGEEILGATIEKGLTLTGSILIALAHYKNYQNCKQLNCSCHED